jgi:hypothetical protein
MPLLSHNGTLTTTVSTWSPERARKEKSSKRPDPPELKPESLKDKKTESLIQKLLNNSANKDFLLALAPDRANQEEPTDTFWKEKSWNFMPRRSNQERNDVPL